MAQPRVPLRSNRRRGPALPGWMLGALVGVFVVATALSGYLVFAAVRDAVAEWRITSNNPSGPVNTDAGGGDGGGGTQGGDSPSGGIIPRRWTGTDRVTVLLMGIDRRPGETGLAFRTDTMMVISIDPDTKRIGILSIPRDLFVVISGYSERQRVNSAMALGEWRQAGSGPQLAMQTVQGNLGIRIHDYMVVDFNAIIGLVDAIGGIDVTIDYTINDSQYPDMYLGYDPFYLPAGTHHLDGVTALKFARTRHGNSDVDRAQRQQQVIYSIRDQVLDFNMLPQLIIQAPTLLETYKDNVYTGLSLQDMIELAWFAKDIPRDNITTGVIDYRYVTNYETDNGSQVLVPNNYTLGNLMVEVFGANYSE